MHVQNIETGNNGNVVHDVKWDFYGQRLAIATSDRTVKIIGLSIYSTLKPLATLRGHQGPVLRVAWAHPKFGSILASCSNEGRVIIWKEVHENVWEVVHAFHEPKFSVSCISWAPHELGLSFACGSSDGSISVLTARSDGGWDTSRIDIAHPGGVDSVSWAPPFALGPMAGSWVLDPVPKLASGGRDSTVRVWRLQKGSWNSDFIPIIKEHFDLARVRDVAGGPNVVRLPKTTIASPSEDLDVVGAPNVVRLPKTTIASPPEDLDVAGGPNVVGLPKTTIASPSEDLDVAGGPNVVGLPKTTIASPSEDLDVGLGDGRRNYYWSVEDDELLISVWLNTSKDSNRENGGKNLAYWRRMAKYFEENHKGKVPRRAGQLNSRWCRINRSVKKFVECYDQASMEYQGETNEKEIIAKARKLYRSQNDGHSFVLEHAWMLLKDEPKWIALITNTSREERCSKRTRVSESGACMSSSNPKTLTNGHMGPIEACEVDLNIEPTKKPPTSEVKSDEDRKPKGACISSSNSETLTTGEMGSPQACEVDLNIEPTKKHAETEGKLKDGRKPEGVLVKELNAIKCPEVKKADAMEDFVQSKLMEIDMRIIYKDTSSMTEEELQLHVPLVQKLKQKYLL